IVGLPGKVNSSPGKLLQRDRDRTSSLQSDERDQPQSRYPRQVAGVTEHLRSRSRNQASGLHDRKIRLGGHVDDFAAAVVQPFDPAPLNVLRGEGTGDDLVGLSNTLSTDDV